ncbi:MULTISPECIES: DUF3551 domain-containing protein [Rhodopseudomonas]|uniref:DUF3551 domain-containing protein n=1 Tax=Rhodopseudomonas palustris TaxID=1076 RepID=A0A0D7E738_RHOPL|nr:MULTISPECIES: DUF3551 domain-containing protein [Rhodopseudomonas]KIZ36684.1 hypothetical protein OO17_24415 [Rhodopseudomonas palustris]MDF3808824.1 DUF3551 domain-containing protein [Rhodopseudomonas sp. BAL398]WOK19144.1 DUF3551 domain-containing protein [Rhodopseudomonas sp. BAL398]
MRIAFVVLLGVLAFPSALLARDYPVCLRIYQGFADYYDECAYTSIPQCQASASGRAAECLVNPFYAGPAARSHRPRAHRSRAHRRNRHH